MFQKVKYSIARAISWTVLKSHLFSRPLYNKKYNFVLCSIFKNEAPFLREWIEYHRIVGVEHFYLYNNNSTDNFSDVLAPYIESGLVSFHDWPQPQGQISAYRHFYENFRGETQWVSFLDLDEFICPLKDNDVLSWLRRHDSYPVVVAYWKMFGTSGLMQHDSSRLVTEQYHVSWPDLYIVGKCFVNTDYDIASFDMSIIHTASVKARFLGVRVPLLPSDQFGNLYSSKETPVPTLVCKSNPDIQINHYWSKAWSVYSEKMRRTDGVFATNPKSNIDYFFRHELMNTSSDYGIYKYLIKLKLAFAGII